MALGVLLDDWRRPPQSSSKEALTLKLFAASRRLLLEHILYPSNPKIQRRPQAANVRSRTGGSGGGVHILS